MQKIANFNGEMVSLVLLEEHLALQRDMHIWECSCGAKFMTVYYASFHCEKQHKGEKFKDCIHLREDFSTSTTKWNAFYTTVSDFILKTTLSGSQNSPIPEKVILVHKKIKENKLHEIEMREDIDKDYQTIEKIAEKLVDNVKGPISENQTQLARIKTVLAQAKLDLESILAHPAEEPLIVSAKNQEAKKKEAVRMRKRTAVDDIVEDDVVIKRKEDAEKSKEDGNIQRVQPIFAQAVLGKLGNISIVSAEKVTSQQPKNAWMKFRQREAADDLDDNAVGIKRKELYRSIKIGSPPVKEIEEPIRKCKKLKIKRASNSKKKSANLKWIQKLRGLLRKSYKRSYKDSAIMVLIIRKFKIFRRCTWLLSGTEEQKEHLTVRVENTTDIKPTFMEAKLKCSFSDRCSFQQTLPISLQRSMFQPRMVTIPGLSIAVPDPEFYPYPDFESADNQKLQFGAYRTPTALVWQKRAEFYQEVTRSNLNPWAAQVQWMQKNVPNGTE